MTLGDVVIQNLGDESIHTKEEIISALRKSSRLVSIPGLGKYVARFYIFRGLELKEQTNDDTINTPGYLESLEFLSFEKQPDGMYRVYRSELLMSKF